MSQLLNTKCVPSFCITFIWKFSDYKENWAKYDQKCVSVFMWSAGCYCQIAMKLEFLDRFSKNTKIQYQFVDNPSSDSWVVTYERTEGRTDGQTWRKVTFWHFANAPKNDSGSYTYINIYKFLHCFVTFVLNIYTKIGCTFVGSPIYRDVQIL
jgi:hypothetical protein